MSIDEFTEIQKRYDRWIFILIVILTMCIISIEVSTFIWLCLMFF